MELRENEISSRGSSLREKSVLRIRRYVVSEVLRVMQGEGDPPIEKFTVIENDMHPKAKKIRSTCERVEQGVYEGSLRGRKVICVRVLKVQLVVQAGSSRRRTLRCRLNPYYR